MIQEFTNGNWILLLGVIFAFAATIIALKGFQDKLPHDQGRAFAVNGELSKGKVRGVGLIFVLVFIAADLLFNSFSIEHTIYLAAIAGCMLSGYFDDAADKPWDEYFKGMLDLVLAAAIAVNYLHFNGNELYLVMLDKTVTLPYWLYGILIVALVWVAINVVNCTDGVDGLSASLSVISLGSFYFLYRNIFNMSGYIYSTLLFMTVLVAYLWFNAKPSTMLMGDAGSRPMGMMIAIVALNCDAPLLFIPFALVMILDGGLGLLKVSVIRFLKAKDFMKNIRCPLHDHARKVLGWSDTQVVMRFCIIQLFISAVCVWCFAALS